MATLIVMPSLGMYTTEATISQWIARPGETVDAGQPIVEVETEKASYEVPAPEGGVFRPVAAIGDVVPDEGLIGYILAPGESVPGEESPAAGPSPMLTQAAVEAPIDGPPVAAAERIKASPLARSRARQHGIDLATVTGTGPRGRIVADDIDAAIVRVVSKPPAYVEKPSAPSVSAPAAPASAGRLAESPTIPPAPRAEAVVPVVGGALADGAIRIPFTGARRVTAERLRGSLSTAASVTLSREVDAEAIWSVREQLKPGFTAGLPFDALFAVAVAAALRARPELNAAVVGDEILQYSDVNIGIAVAAPSGELFVPVVRRVDARSFGEIVDDVIRLSGKARERRLSMDDVSEGTFTITNLGNYGIDAFTPIVNPPQSGILGIGRIAKQPVVQDGRIAVRRRCVLSLTFDHRVVNGAPAALVLDAITGNIESESRLRDLMRS